MESSPSSSQVDTEKLEALWNLLTVKPTEEDKKILQELEVVGLEIGIRMYWRQRLIGSLLEVINDQ